MNKRCPICMRPLPAQAAGIKAFGGGGRVWFGVHRENCADVVESVTHVGLTALILKGKGQFMRRAPLLAGVVQEYVRRRQNRKALDE